MRNKLTNLFGTASIVASSYLSGCGMFSNDYSGPTITYQPLAEVMASNLEQKMKEAKQNKNFIALDDLGETYVSLGKIDEAISIVSYLQMHDRDSSALILAKKIQIYINDNPKEYTQKQNPDKNQTSNSEQPALSSNADKN